MLIKGKIFFYSFFLQTICAEFFNIHPIKIKKLSQAEKVSIKNKMMLLVASGRK